MNLGSGFRTCMWGLDDRFMGGASVFITVNHRLRPLWTCMVPSSECSMCSRSGRGIVPDR